MSSRPKHAHVGSDLSRRLAEFPAAYFRQGSRSAACCSSACRRQREGFGSNSVARVQLAVICLSMKILRSRLVFQHTPTHRKNAVKAPSPRAGKPLDEAVELRDCCRSGSSVEWSAHLGAARRHALHAMARRARAGVSPMECSGWLREGHPRCNDADVQVSGPGSASCRRTRSLRPTPPTPLPSCRGH